MTRAKGYAEFYKKKLEENDKRIEYDLDQWRKYNGWDLMYTESLRDLFELRLKYLGYIGICETILREDGLAIREEITK